MENQVDISESVAPESNNAQNDFEFKKRVPVTTVPEVATSFVLIGYASPTAAGLGCGAPWQGGPGVLLHICLQPSSFGGIQQ